jgi:hypothetical protein
MRPSLLIAGGLLALALSGCQQGNLAQRELKVEQKICDQLASVGKALEGVAVLSPSSTVGEARKAEQTLASAVAALEASEQKLEDLRLKDFGNQLRSFRGEVAKVAANKSLTLEQAATELKGKAAPVLEARRKLAETVQCEAETKP